MLRFTDQTGHSIQLARKPQRIVSLVPSQTELLFSLGLNEEVVGITKFCVHPQQWFHGKTRVGGTKQLKPEIIDRLHPDLIIANKEENLRDEVEHLMNRYPVWISDIRTLDDACDMIMQIGAITGKERNALLLVNKIRTGFQALPDPGPLTRAAYLIWREPLMTVGGDTFIHEMMLAAGLENVFGSRERYPQVSIGDIRDAGVQCLLLSSEPYPFKQQHIDELQPALPGTRIILVDGEMFSWYGSRLVESPAYFARLRKLIEPG